MMVQSWNLVGFVLNRGFGKPRKRLGMTIFNNFKYKDLKEITPKPNVYRISYRVKKIKYVEAMK